MSAYYNEIDPYAAQWLRNLIAEGLIATGDVDERSIVDVRAGDLAGYTQCHFFAGISGWSLALRLAGWPDGESAWTGSCPCQPLSSAGKRKGHADERHLWPTFHRLIAECKPPVVFGEQVASKDGREWLSAVRADLEADGYACGASDLCGASIGAPEIRQRIWWVADADDTGLEGRFGAAERATERAVGQRGMVGRLVNADSGRAGTQPGDHREAGEEAAGRARAEDRPALRDGTGTSSRLADTSSKRVAFSGDDSMGSRPRPTDGFWRDADWLFCRDGLWRPVEPGTFPLAHGISNRVGRLRAYGNAIMPPLAAEFIAAFMEAKAEQQLRQAA